MNKLLNSNFGAQPARIVLLLLSIGISGMMLVHGIPKMEILFSGETIQFPEILRMSAAFSLSLAVFAEVLCSILILFGFTTRLATIPLIVTMLIAVFVIHANDPFLNQELGLHYLLVYLALLLLGGGKYSVDAFLMRNRKEKQPGICCEVVYPKMIFRRPGTFNTEPFF